MARLMMSNSEVQAICRNRNEQRNLSGKLDQLDHIAFQSKDAIQQDLRTWRQFRRENVKNSGWSPKSIRPEPGEDVFFNVTSGGRMGSTPHSPTQGKDTSFAKPWAYSYSQASHNKVYKELAQSSQNAHKALDLNLKSKSLDSSTGDDQPAMLKHVKTVQTLNKAASALTPFHSKLLSKRQNEDPGTSLNPAQENSNSSFIQDKMASNVRTMETVSKFSAVYKKNKAKKRYENPGDRFVKSVKAMKGVATSRKKFSCYSCGQNLVGSKKEERFPQVALAYKGIHRAQTNLKFSVQQDKFDSNEHNSNEEQLDFKRCCLECRNKQESASNMCKNSKEKVTKNSKGKVSVASSLTKTGSKSISKSYPSFRRLSSVSNLSEEQIRRLQVAKEKVSRCFEIPTYDDTASSTNTEGNNTTNVTKSEGWKDNSSLLGVSYDKAIQKVNLRNDTGKIGISNNVEIVDIHSNSTKQKPGFQEVSTHNTLNMQNKCKIRQQSLQSLRETYQEVECKQNDFLADNHPLDNPGEEYLSDVSHQQVMKVIQEEVIDKLNKLKNKGNSPPCVRKFSTLSRASTVFKLGVHRKKKMNKTSGMDVFTRIAKYMLFEVWRRRRERKMQLEQDEINKSSKKISQANFRAKFLALSKLSDVKIASEDVEDSSPAPQDEVRQQLPQMNKLQFLGNWKSALTDNSTENLNNKYNNSASPFFSNSSHNLEDNKCSRENTKLNFSNGNELERPEEKDTTSKTSVYSNPKKQTGWNTKPRLSIVPSSNNKEINNGSNQINNIDSEKKVFVSNKNNKKNLNNASDSTCQLGNDTKYSVDIQADNANAPSSETSGETRPLPHQIQKRRKPPWMSGNDALHHDLRPEVYHKGIRLSNYVCPEKRYLDARRQKVKKDLSVRWHSAVGAMVNKHEVSQEPMLAEKTFPKQARNRALHKMIEANHTPAPDDTAKIQNDILHSRIQDFLHSVEPYRQK